MIESICATVEDVEHNKEFSKNTNIELVDDTFGTEVKYDNDCKTNIESNVAKNEGKNDIETVAKPKKIESLVKKYHSTNVVVGDITEGRKTRRKRHVDNREMAGMIGMACYTSAIEPKNIEKQSLRNTGLKPCRRNFNSLKGMIYGNLCPDQE